MVTNRPKRCYRWGLAFGAKPLGDNRLTFQPSSGDTYQPTVSTRQPWVRKHQTESKPRSGYTASKDAAAPRLAQGESIIASERSRSPT